MSTNQEVLINYHPTEEEEKARLAALITSLTEQKGVLDSDPLIAEEIKIAKKAASIKKKAKALEEKIHEAERKLRALNKVKLEEPTENGFYVVRRVSQERHGIETNQKLFIRVFGDWLDVSYDEWWKNVRGTRNRPFSDFLGIDEDVVEASIEKIENLDEMPEFLVGKPWGYQYMNDEDADDEDDEVLL